MIDIKSFIYSLKLSWLKRLIQSKADWTFIANIQIPSVNKLLTYGKEKLTQLRAKITNSFYMDVINALIMFNTYYEPNNDEILTETIWFSAYSGFPTSIVKKWDSQGLRFICDLFNPVTGCLLPIEDIRERFQIEMTFLCYARLVQKLPQSLIRHERKNLTQPNIPYKILRVTGKAKF